MILRICVCIPTFNNSRTISRVVERVLTTTSCPVVVIDDGSTIPAAALLPPDQRLAVVRHSENRGKGAALATAFQWALQRNFTHVITLDADGQHQPEDINAFVQAIQENPWNLMIGSRRMPADAPKISLFGRKFSNFWLWFQTGVWVEDSQCGFRAYPLFYVQNLATHMVRFEFELVVCIQLFWAGVHVQDIPISVRYFFGSDRVSHFHKFYDNVRITVMNLYYIALSLLTLRAGPIRAMWQRIHEIAGTRMLRKQTAAWTGQMRGGRLGRAIVTGANQFLGQRFCYGLMFFVVPYFYFFAPRARRSSQQLAVQLGLGKTWWQRLSFVMGNLLVFSTILLDRLYQSRFAEAKYAFTGAGGPGLLDALSNNSGCVLVTAHFGALDNCARATGHKGIFDRMVRAEFVADRGQTLEKYLQRKEKVQFEIPIISQKEQSILAFRDMLENGKGLIMMGDRPLNQHYELVPFLGKLAAIDVTPFCVAKACSKEVLFCYGIKTGMWSYHLVVERPGGFSSSLDYAVGFARSLESHVRQYPLQWANFFPFWSEKPNPPVRFSGVVTERPARHSVVFLDLAVSEP